MSGYPFTTLHRTRFFLFLVAHQIVCLIAFAARLIMVCAGPNAFARFMKWKSPLGPTLMKFSWLDYTVTEQPFVLEYLPMVIMTILEAALCCWSVLILHRVNVYTATLRSLFPFVIASAIYWPSVFAMGFFYLFMDIFWGGLLTISSYGFFLYLVGLAIRRNRASDDTIEARLPTYHDLEHDEQTVPSHRLSMPYPESSRLRDMERLMASRASAARRHP